MILSGFTGGSRCHKIKKWWAVPTLHGK